MFVLPVAYPQVTFVQGGWVRWQTQEGKYCFLYISHPRISGIIQDCNKSTMKPFLAQTLHPSRSIGNGKWSILPISQGPCTKPRIRNCSLQKKQSQSFSCPSICLTENNFKRKQTVKHNKFIGKLKEIRIEIS